MEVSILLNQTLPRITMMKLAEDETDLRTVELGPYLVQKQYKMT